MSQCEEPCAPKRMAVWWYISAMVKEARINFLYCDGFLKAKHWAKFNMYSTKISVFVTIHDTVSKLSALAGTPLLF